MALRARLAFAKPDTERSETAAEELRRLGFLVRSVRPVGITIEGEQTLYERAFGCRFAAPAGGLEPECVPHLPENLAGNGAELYFPTKPTFFP